MGKYLCTNCRLWWSTRINPPDLSGRCPACKAELNATVREWEQSVRDRAEENRIA